MYGAEHWEMECTEMTTEAGLKQGSYSACVFYLFPYDLSVDITRAHFFLFCDLLVSGFAV